MKSPASATAAAVLAGILAGMLPPPAQALSVGQIDTFSGSLNGWSAGGGPLGLEPPVPPQVVTSGGPGGSGDSYMLVTSGGGAGPGSRMVVMNVLGQWSGNFLDAGITAIAMDLRNLGSTELSMRLLFEDPIPNPPANEALSLSPVTLAAGGGWQHVVFQIDASDLLAQRGDVATALSGNTVLRLFHSTTAAFPGEPVVALLGVDNVQAVPEVHSLAAMVAGLGLLAALGAHRRSRSVRPD